jgi:hypothetical protein
LLATCDESTIQITIHTRVDIAVGFTSGRVSNDVEEGTDVYFNIPDLIASLVANRSSLDHPTIPDGVMDLSNLVKRLLPLTHDGRALRSDVDYGIADFVAKLLDKVATDKDGHARPEEGALSLVLVLLLLGKVVCDRYGDTSLEELFIDALNQDCLRALAGEFSAVPMKLDHEGRPIPILSMLDIFFTARPITNEMRDGYVQRRKLPYLTDEPFESTQSQEHDFEILDLTRPSGKCDLSDFDNLIADSCNGFDDYEDFYFDNQDRYHNDE